MDEDNSKRLYDRLYKRLYKSKDENDFYEAHQLYRILYNRLANKDETVTEDLLHEGANYLLKNSQFESGTDLVVLLIKYYIDKKKTVNEILILKLKNYYSAIKEQSEERRNMCMWIDKWLVGDESNLWHNWIAVISWSEGDLVNARYHFMLSGQGVHTALFLIHFQRKKGYKSEIDIFLVQAVLQFLCLQRVSAASSTFSVYVKYHPELQQAPPFIGHPLLNFIWLLLLSIDSHLSTAVYSNLCDQYSKHLDRDPLYADYLTRIGHLYFNVPTPSKKDSFISNIMSMLVGGPPGDDDGTRVLESPVQFSTEEMD